MFACRTLQHMTGPASRPPVDPSGPWPAVVTAPVQALAARLRTAGLAVSTSEVLDAVAALARVDVTRRGHVRASLRATMLKDPVHTAAFERAFEALFPRLLPRPAGHAGDRPGAPPPADGTAPGPDPDQAARLARALHEGDDDALRRLLREAVARFAGTDQGRSVEHHTRRTLRRLDLTGVFRQLLAQRPADQADSDLARSAAGTDADLALARLRQVLSDVVAEQLLRSHGQAAAPEDPELADLPLLEASPDEVQALRQAVRPLARRLATRLGRRRRRGRGGLDMRRTIRRSMGTGGVPVTPALRRRHPTRPDLLLLCDVSGSMLEYVPFALTLLHAVHREFTRVRSFVFVDGLVEVSDVLASSEGVLDPRQFLDRRGLVAADGRSDYPRVFSAFLRRYADLVTGRTTTVVIGDARSHHRRPAVPEIRELAYRSRRLYWLNPEPRSQWDTTDSRLSAYAVHCTDTFEVASLRQLADAVARIA
jgi:hypothetical protein